MRSIILPLSLYMVPLISAFRYSKIQILQFYLSTCQHSNVSQKLAFILFRATSTKRILFLSRKNLSDPQVVLKSQLSIAAPGFGPGRWAKATWRATRQWEKNPFPDQAEMHFLMGKSLHACSKEWGRGKWTQRNFICLPCSPLVSSLTRSRKRHHPLCADTSTSWPDEAEPNKRFLLTGPKRKPGLGWLKEVLLDRRCWDVSPGRGICHHLQSCLRTRVWMPKFPECRDSPAGLECPERALQREHCLPASSSVCQSIPVWICEGGIVPKQ